MADARALLRAERASRRITHPHASYTGDGKLLCNLCETLVKSDAHWQSHLHSTQHNLRSQRQQDVAASKKLGGDGAGKKRKAESIESPQQDRKKARPEPVNEAEAQADGEEATVEDGPAEPTATPSKPGTTPAKANDINADDILAFERELATLEADAAREEAAARQEAVRNAATISAAPLTAEELAAQAREEQSQQRGRRDAEIEDEREDAARVLEEEMEEMEGLEDRVRKLREKREALRGSGSPPAAGDGTVQAERAINGEATKDTDSSDEDDDEDFDEWKFGGS